MIGVFGANGFIGRHVVRRLIGQGLPVVAFGRDFPADYAELVGGPVEIRRIDLMNSLETHASLQDVSTVVQLINSSTPGMANNQVVSDLNNNVAPQISFIEACIVSKVKNFIFISSGGTVYGMPKYLPIDEKHPTSPLNSYGMTKLIVEQYLELLSRNTDTGYTNLRVSNPYGPGQDSKKGQGLIGTILKLHRLRQPLTILGDGTSQRDYLYIDDLMDAVAAAVERPPINGPLNIGSGTGRSVLDVIAGVEHLLGQPLLVQYAPGRTTDVPVNILDVKKAADLLGWVPSTDFEDGLARTLATWKY
ncbi:NAD-dependent epimerase/dehydratase family protein [Sphingomonas prati]|nr:NAD-dependent epimerase/dehydratase family protein [Sphingomonas prati]